MSILTLSGSPYHMKTSQTVPLAFDVTNQLGTGDTVSLPVVTLTDNNGTVITLTDPPTVLGNVITQIFRGSALTPGNTYTVNGSYTANTNKVLAFDCVIVCVP